MISVLCLKGINIMREIYHEMGEMIDDIKDKITDNEYLAIYNKLRDLKEFHDLLMPMTSSQSLETREIVVARRMRVVREVASLLEEQANEAEARTTALQNLVDASEAHHRDIEDTVPVWLPYDGVASDPMGSLRINGDAIYDQRRAQWDDEGLDVLSPEELVTAGPRFQGGPRYDAPRLRDLLRYDTLPVATDQVRLRELLSETQSASRDTELMRETEAYLRRRSDRHRYVLDQDSPHSVPSLDMESAV